MQERMCIHMFMQSKTCCFSQCCCVLELSLPSSCRLMRVCVCVWVRVCQHVYIPCVCVCAAEVPAAVLGVESSGGEGSQLDEQPAAV